MPELVWSAVFWFFGFLLFLYFGLLVLVFRLLWAIVTAEEDRPEAPKSNTK